MKILVSVNAGLDIEIKGNQVYMSPHINLAPVPNTEFKENTVEWQIELKNIHGPKEQRTRL
jgi:hypothetical protein